MIICILCKKLFTTQSTHNRHVRVVHNQVPKPFSYGKDSRWSNQCLDCDSSFPTNKRLINHLEEFHNIGILVLFLFETQHLPLLIVGGRYLRKFSCWYYQSYCIIINKNYYKCLNKYISYRQVGTYLRMLGCFSEQHVFLY